MQHSTHRLVGTLAALAILLSACALGSAHSSPAAAYGAREFSRALQVAGATVRQGDSFVADPLAGRGANICVDGQQVAVYSFASSDDRAREQARIDPADPGHVGNAIVDWIGTPRFWARDLIIVRYNGPDQAVKARITVALGAPFAVDAQVAAGGQPQLFGC